MLFILFALLGPVSFAAEGVPAANCARVSLSAIYGAERSYHSEYERYSESYGDIGFEPDTKECPEWEGSVRVFNGGQEFLATYTKPSTGETWTINEKKEIRQFRFGTKHSFRGTSEEVPDWASMGSHRPGRGGNSFPVRQA